MKTNIFSILDENGDLHWGKLFMFLVGLVLLAFALNTVAYLVGFADSWIGLPARKLDAQNVENEYEWFYNMHQSLRASKANVRNLEAKQTNLSVLYGQDTTKWPESAKDEYKQTGQQILQLQTAYNQACADYQARWDNYFHSIVAPGDIPRDCELID